MKPWELLKVIGGIDDELIEQADQTVSRPGILRRALVAAAVICALALTAGAAYVAINWNDIFISSLRPDSKVAEQLSTALDEPFVRAESDGVALSVLQTLGDNYNLLVLFTLRLPEDFNMDCLVVDENQRPDMIEKGLCPQGQDGRYYYCNTLGFDENGNPTIDFSGMWELSTAGTQAGASTSFTLESVDTEAKEMTLMARMTVSGSVRDDITLTVREIGALTMGWDGEVSVSWTPDYQVQSRRYPVARQGVEQGFVEISPISINIRVNNGDEFFGEPEADAEYDSLEQAALAEMERQEAVTSAIVLEYADGSTESFGEISRDLSGSVSRCLVADANFNDDGTLEASLSFRQLMDPESIVAIRIGDTTVYTAD